VKQLGNLKLVESSSYVWWSVFPLLEHADQVRGRDGMGEETGQGTGTHVGW
jgi:hypothetical protein